MKTVYLVRHGETDANVLKAMQGPEQPLNTNGHAQAKRVAARAKNLAFARLITSPFRRARETAEHISAASGKPIEESTLFQELKPPTSLSTGEPTAEKIAAAEAFRKLRSEHAHDAAWHYEDEENPAELFARVDQALDFLVATPEANLMVVSHMLFLRALVGYVINGRDTAPGQFGIFRQHMQMHNTGITVIVYTDGVWKLRCFNDHAHFADD